MSAPSISIIIPVLNEADHVAALLTDLRVRDRTSEVIVVDGGSDDETVARAKSYDCQVIQSARGRAEQMNRGAEVSAGDILVFLHVDTQLPDDFYEALDRFWTSAHAWGRFDVRLDSDRPVLRMVALMMNIRSRLTGICTGDQAIFVKHSVFDQIGGFAPIPLMEDIEISKRLKSVSSPYCITSPVITSSRRWEKHGAIRTILLMWWLRLRYFMGDTPESLARQYQ